MKMAPADFRSEAAFNRLELLLVISIAVLLGAMALTYLAQRRTKVQQMQCVNNLKQVGIGLRFWTPPDFDYYPQYHPTNEAWNYFQIIGDEMGTPKVLFCPADPRLPPEPPALNFNDSSDAQSLAHISHRNQSVSYFYIPGSDETQPGNIITGDRNLSTNEQILSGVLTVSGKNTAAHWTKAAHRQRGNVGFVDGSVQTVTTSQLQTHLKAFRYSAYPGQSNLTDEIRVVLP